MREKYESLALADLKAIAKARGIKGTTAMKKSDVVEAMRTKIEQIADNNNENINKESGVN